MNDAFWRDLVSTIADAVIEQLTPLLRSMAAPQAGEPDLDPALLNWRQVSQRLGGLSESSVRALWTSGELPSVTVGALRFTRAADLAAYVDSLQPSLPGEERRLSVVRNAA